MKSKVAQRILNDMEKAPWHIKFIRWVKLQIWIYGCLIFNPIKNCLALLSPLLRALQLWCLNLIFPICFIIVLPLLVNDLTDIPLTVYKLFKMWIVDGIRVHLVLYLLCFIVVICEEK